jgi:hemoglobin
MNKDSEDIDDIRLLVDSFYGTVREDDLIGPIFLGKITDWPVHLEKMYRFWQTILLEEYTYNGAPFPPHATLPIQEEHFNRWLKLWGQTVDQFFEGDVAEEAKWRGERMAGVFLSKLEYLQKYDIKPLI